MLLEGIEFLARAIDLAGIGIIFWGVGAGLVGFVATLLPRRSERTSLLQSIAHIRCKVGTYILLGLEIMIASDIAQTVIEPTYEKVILLCAIVAIRTILGFFLSRELEAIASG